jgi:hypothetical protein
VRSRPTTIREAIIMKALICAALAATVLAAPALSFAQSANGPVTRAEVEANLVQMEKAGYQPGRRDPYYPADIQAAEARMPAQAASDNSSGGMTDGTSGAGMSATPFHGRSIYFGH